MECAHLSTDTLDDGSRVCVDCGALLDTMIFSTLEYRQEQYTAPPAPQSVPLIATKIHQKSYSERGKERLAKTLHEISTAYGWAGESQRIMEHHQSLYHEGKSDYGQGGDKTIAALYFLFGRQNGLPISLSRISALLDYPPSEIGKQVGALLARYPELATSSAGRFLARHLSFLSSGQNGSSDLDPAQIRAITAQFSQLSDYLHKCGFQEGRFPEPFSLACLLLCAESTLHRPLPLESICDRIGLPPSTVYRRYAETKKHLLAQAKLLLPWGHLVKNSNVLEYLGELLPVLRVRFAPPAYVRSVADSAERLSLLERVKNGEISSHEAEEAFIIEYLLETGWSEEQIINTPRLNIESLM